MNAPINSAFGMRPTAEDRRHQQKEDCTKPAVRLIDVNAIAQKLGCSSRHVYRLEEEERMPRATRLGALVRWSESLIDQWIENGCPDCKNL